MEKNTTVTSRANPKIQIHVTAGHFASASAHRNNFIDIFDLKCRSSAAKEAARELSKFYLANTVVDMIVCMDGTEILGAYMADELLQAGSGVINQNSEIYVVTPTLRADHHYFFHQSVHEKIKGKQALLLVASMSTGATVSTVMECLSYYGCKLAGISAVFTTVPSINDVKINSLFTNFDIPEFRYYDPSECVLCKKGRKLDAVFSSEGYNKL